MNKIFPLAHRRQPLLTVADIPDGTTSIGDAAFSLCPLLKQVVIPASVEYIGVAAFCGSGIEVAKFLGVPKDIEPSVFADCKRLNMIVVPKGTKNHFAKIFPATLLQETTAKPANADKGPQDNPQPTSTGLSGQPINKRCSLTYNFHIFNWAKGDKVKLNELFSGPIAIISDPSYQFRRKCLFVFMKSKTAAGLAPFAQYAIPANTTHFTRKYKEKYGSRQARIFLFVCDDGQTATFYDEVKYVTAHNNTITIKSVL